MRLPSQINWFFMQESYTYARASTHTRARALRIQANARVSVYGITHAKLASTIHYLFFYDIITYRQAPRTLIALAIH